MPAYLASEQINTPDPCRLCYQGQQLVVHWRLPDTAVQPAELVLQVRYGNHECETITHPITKRRGYWIYRLVNADYWEREGIVTYRATLCRGGTAICTREHHLWTEILTIVE